MTNSTDWAFDNLQALKAGCMEAYKANNSLWVNETGQLSLPSFITDNLCSNDCSNNGRCSQGDGYAGHRRHFLAPFS